MKRFEEMTRRAARGGMVLFFGVLAACAGPGPKQGEGGDAPEKARELAAFDYRLAEKFWEQGQADLAVRYLDRAARKEPDSPAPRLQILDVYLAEGNPDAVLAYLERLSPEMRARPAFRAREALALDLCGRGREAGRILEALAAAPESGATFLVACAEHQAFQARREEALELLRRGLEAHPGDAVLLRAAADLAGALGRSGEAAEDRSRLIETGKGSRRDLEAAAEAYLRAGRGWEGLARISAAAEKGRVDRAVASAVLADLRYRLGEYAAARGLLEEAFRSKAWRPSREDRLRLAELRLRAGAFPEGAELLERELRARPEDSVVRAALAWALYRAGRSAASRRVLARVPGGGAEKDELLRSMRERLEGADHAPVPE